MHRNRLRLMQDEKSIYLPGLNGIRAIAAIAVVISHIGLNLKLYNISNFGGYALASHGVTMFFSLSGFLITYLLLIEKENSKTISVRKFYIRRALRIWPLYYFYLIVTLFVIGFAVNQYAWMYFFLMPNIPFAMTASGFAIATLPHLAHYWSVGVEEQFYAFWPWLIKKNKKLLLVMCAFSIAFFLFKIGLTIFHAPKLLITLIHYTRFGCMAMGGIAAFLLIKKNQVFLSIFQSKIAEIIAWGVIALIAINKFHLFSIIDHEIVTIVTLIVIINQVNNSKRLISLENRILDYLGKISYGIYIYNPLLIFLTSLFLKEYLPQSKFLSVILIFVVTIIIVIGVSHISYFYFERKLLKFKDKFTVIPSKSSAS